MAACLANLVFFRPGWAYFPGNVARSPATWAVFWVLDLLDVAPVPGMKRLTMLTLMGSLLALVGLALAGEDAPSGAVLAVAMIAGEWSD